MMLHAGEHEVQDLAKRGFMDSVYAFKSLHSSTHANLDEVRWLLYITHQYQLAFARVSVPHASINHAVVHVAKETCI